MQNGIYEGESLRGAIVFLAAFFIFLLITLGYRDLPPGQMIYDAANLPETIDYDLLGLPAETLVIALFNGIIYGIIIWLIYWLAEKAGLISKKQQKPATTAAT